MKKIFTGKTKDVYQLDDGNIKLVFKDDMTGADGVFDPGANTVGLTVDGAGKAGLAMSVYYFKLLGEKGYATHFISARDDGMIVKAATPFGDGLEVICRYKALGSFTRRYGAYIDEGAALDGIIEFTLKDDERGDPQINEDALVALGILSEVQYGEIKSVTQKICDVIKADLAQKGLELCDIKLEFGMDVDGNVMLIDEFSGGNMRVFDAEGKTVLPLELSKSIVCSE